MEKSCSVSLAEDFLAPAKIIPLFLPPPQTVEHGILGTTKARGNHLGLVEARRRLIARAIPDPGLNNNIRCGVGSLLRQRILLEYHPVLCRAHV